MQSIRSWPIPRENGLKRPGISGLLAALLLAAGPVPAAVPVASISLTPQSQYVLYFQRDIQTINVMDEQPVKAETDGKRLILQGLAPGRTPVSLILQGENFVRTIEVLVQKEPPATLPTGTADRHPLIKRPLPAAEQPGQQPQPVPSAPEEKLQAQPEREKLPDNNQPRVAESSPDMAYPGITLDPALPYRMNLPLPVQQIKVEHEETVLAKGTDHQLVLTARAPGHTLVHVQMAGRREPYTLSVQVQAAPAGTPQTP